jgi:VIT1/CCC1 family predicted Fe2+/Mn2+ transporter
MEFLAAAALLIIGAIANETVKRVLDRRASYREQYIRINERLKDVGSSGPAIGIKDDLKTEKQLLENQRKNLHEWLETNHRLDGLAIVGMIVGLASIFATVLPGYPAGFMFAGWAAGVVVTIAGIILGLLPKRP